MKGSGLSSGGAADPQVFGLASCQISQIYLLKSSPPKTFLTPKYLLKNLTDATDMADDKKHNIKLVKEVKV